MILHLLILVFIFPFSLTSKGTVSRDYRLKEPIVAPALLSLDVIPPCLFNCSLSYFSSLESLYLNNSTQFFVNQMCNPLNDTLTCLHSHCSSPSHLTLSLSVLSGIQYSCEQRTSFEAIVPCANAYADLRNSCSHCDVYQSALSLIQSSDTQNILSSDRSSYRLLGLAGDFCGNFTCSLLCVRQNVNEKCMKSGTKLVELFVRPLSHLYTAFIHSEIKREIGYQMPKKCKKLMTKDTLKSLFFDDSFREDLSKWIDERRKKDLELKRTKKKKQHVSHDDSFSSFLSKMEKPFYIFFIPFILLLNLSALVVSVIWCVKTREKVDKYCGSSTVLSSHSFFVGDGFSDTTVSSSHRIEGIYRKNK